MNGSESLNSQLETGNSKLLEEHPPFLKTWHKLYSFVVAELVVLIIVFYAFMKLFS